MATKQKFTVFVDGKTTEVISETRYLAARKGLAKLVKNIKTIQVVTVYDHDNDETVSYEAYCTTYDGELSNFNSIGIISTIFPEIRFNEKYNRNCIDTKSIKHPYRLFAKRVLIKTEYLNEIEREWDINPYDDLEVLGLQGAYYVVAGKNNRRDRIEKEECMIIEFGEELKQISF